MKISQDIKDLINNIPIYYTKDNDTLSFLKKSTEYSNIYAIFAIQLQEDELIENSIHFVGLVDTNKDEFIYIDAAKYKYYKNILLKNPKDFKKIDIYEEMNKAIAIIQNKLKEYIDTDYIIDEYEASIGPINKDELDNEVALYIDGKRKDEFIEDFYINEYIKPSSLHWLCTFCLNKEKLYNDIIKEYIDDNLSSYKEFIYINQKINKRLNEIKMDELNEQKEDILKICEEYSSINIHYETLNGDKKAISINTSNILKNKSELYLNNILELDKDFPIEEIIKITANKKELYNKANYKKQEKTKYERAIIWYETKNIDNIDKEMFNDKEFMEYIIKDNARNMHYLGNNLKEDYEFILDIITQKEINFFFIKDLFLKDDFIEYFFSEIKSNNLTKAQFDFILDNIDKSYYKDDEKLKKLITSICPADEINNILKRLSKEMLNETKIFKEIDYHYIKNINNKQIKKITNAKQLYSMCTNEYAIRALNSQIKNFSDEVIKDRDFIHYLLSHLDTGDIYRENDYKKIITMYKDDEQIINAIAKILIKPDLNSFMKLAEIDETNIDRIFELSSINNDFFNVLTEKDICTYLTCEASEIYNIEMYETELTIKTAYGRFVYESPNIFSFEDQNFTEYLINIELDPKYAYEVENVLVESLKEYNINLKGCTNLEEIYKKYIKNIEHDISI